MSRHSQQMTRRLDKTREQQTLPSGFYPTKDDPTTRDLAIGLKQLIENVFKLYVKTRHLHWCVDHTQDSRYTLLLDEHAEQLSDLMQRASNQLNELFLLRANLSSNKSRTPTDPKLDAH